MERTVFNVSNSLRSAIVKPIFLDYETFFSKDYSLKKMSTRQYIYDPQFKIHGASVAIGKGEPQWFTGARLEAVLRAVVPGNVVVCHNASFDGAILAWVFNLFPKLLLDTVAMSRAIVGERVKSHALDSVAKFVLGREKGGYLANVMGVRDLSEEQKALLGSYCVEDTRLCRDIFYALIPYVPMQELKVIDMVSRMFTEPVLWLDQDMLISYHSEIVSKRLQALDEAGIQNPSEVRSNPQFAQALVNLGVDPPRKISPTTGEETWAFAKTDEGLQALADHEDIRVQALVAARLQNKSTIAETRAEAFIEAARYGELPVPYLYSGAQTTHRLSGSGGINMQNLPRVKKESSAGALRMALMAPAGFTLVPGDQAQVELRITLALAIHLWIRNGGGDYCAEFEALQLLATGGDLYSTFGSTIYNKTITKESHPLERQVAKSAVLGLGFGMGATKFKDYCRASGIEINDDFANYVVKLYRGRFINVTKLWKYIQDCFKRFLVTQEEIQVFTEPDIWITMGLWDTPQIGVRGQLQVKYPGLSMADSEVAQFPEVGMSVNRREIYYMRGKEGRTKIFGGKFVENLVQYLARQIIMEQTVEINKRYKVAMSTHDEVVPVVPLEEEEEGKQFVKSVMERSLSWWPSLPLNAEVHSAVRYGDAK